MPEPVSPVLSKKKAFVFLKILLSLLPALVFLQSYGWMTLYKNLGIAFILILALVIGSVWQLSQKNRIITRLVRLLEMGLFFLPIATIIMTFVLGSSLAAVAGNNASKAGAAIGVGLGGFFVTIIAFVIGIAGGIITHLIGNSYSKKADSEFKEQESFLNQHGTALVLLGLFLLTIVLPQFGKGGIKDAISDSGSAQSTSSTTDDVKVTATADQKPNEPATPSPLDVSAVTISRDAINQPEANLTVTNTSDRKVSALKIRLLVYTKFNEPVKNSFSLLDGSNEFIGIYQENDILPGGKKALTWQLTGFDGAGKATAKIYQVKFDDGTEWKSANFKE